MVRENGVGFEGETGYRDADGSVVVMVQRTKAKNGR